MDKYHIALSFAGEDRDYVEEVANDLRDHGVDVFYDKFEETKLWGKDLYTYLRDIYQNKALYTIIFVSKAYRDNLWPNHERESAQARAFAESKEYILPATFDEKVEIPGLLKTTGYIKLNDLSPNKFARKIIEKLEGEGVFLSVDSKFEYSNYAKADVDFQMLKGDEITQIIQGLRSYDWYKQHPIIVKIFDLDWSKVTNDQLFVIGRNIYQCACGGERRALEIVKDLRREMTKVPIEVAEHLLNGMFYEVYFNSVGEFRGNDLKNELITSLFKLQTVDKYVNCISFIRKVLQPYRSKISVLPNETPEKVVLQITVKKKDHPIVNSIKFMDNELITDEKEDDHSYSRIWKLSFREFSLDYLSERLSDAWNTPDDQLELIYDRGISPDTMFRLPEGKTIKQPFST
ncbi:MAG: TIR domain-containing protein [Candidatus Marinimicrobia bacterium]|jgi:uncharacterized protein related to proFAR isomerase|nr:TIR domain-containing protein [Candidatus Neomarinimicrobiota bacterium]